MKAKDIARNYGVDRSAFETWLKDSSFPVKVGGMGGLVVDDGEDISEVVNSFKRYDAERHERIARQRSEAERAAQQKQQELAKILITSGFSFHGYSVTKYSDYISGDDVIQVNRGTAGLFGGGSTDVGASLMASMAIMRRNALAELKEAAYELGCNAVIGVDFDYLTLAPETASSSGGTMYLPYVFGVTANGNAVVVDKEGDLEL
jgi:uncharacterized protein YbjQ (UPF0145 family)